jgi:hypothetical protein
MWRDFCFKQVLLNVACVEVQQESRKKEALLEKGRPLLTYGKRRL